MITDAETLRALYGPPSERAANKVLDHVDAHARAFVEASPFILIATSDGASLDVSPKGDAPGFVQVEEGSRAILIPDWPGNNRIDGLMNVVAHPRAAVIFIVPTVRETIRVNGPASILDEEAARRPFARGDRLPITVLRVETEEVFAHCAKSFLRSSLWDPDSWPEARPTPTMGEMMNDHGRLSRPVETEDEMLARYARELD